MLEKGLAAKHAAQLVGGPWTERFATYLLERDGLWNSWPVLIRGMFLSMVVLPAPGELPRYP